MDSKKPLSPVSNTADSARGLSMIESNERKFHTLLMNIEDGIAILSEEGKPMYVSPSVQKILGFSEEELMEMDLLTLTHPEDLGALGKVMKKVLANPGVPIKGHTGRMRHKNGSWRWVEATVTNMLDDPAIRGIVDNFRDITTRRLADEKLRHTNRLYAFISQINQLIMRASDEKTVFQGACRVAVVFGKFKTAWIGIIEAERQKINLVAQYGMSPGDERAFKNTIYEKNGTQARVLETGKSVICNNIARDLEDQKWQQYGAMMGYAAFMVIPLRKSGKIIGTLNIYTSHLNFFDSEAVDLLEEGASDISFAIEAFEKERRKLRADEKLQYSENQLNQAQKIAHLGSWELDYSTGAVTWSEEMLRIYGLPVDEKDQTLETWMSFIHPEDLDYVMKMTKEAEVGLRNTAFYYRIIRKDGSIRHIYSQSEFRFDSDNEIINWYGVALDVTDVRQAEEEIRRSESNLKAIIENTDSAIYSINTDFKYVAFNQSLCYFLKDIYDYKITPGNDTFEFLEQSDPASIPEWRRVYARAFSGETVKFVNEYTFDGVTTYISFSIYPIWEDTRVIGVSCFVNDITKEKQEILQREKLTADLTKRNKDLEQFSFIVSHVLRAPVASIIGLGSLLEEGIVTDADEKEGIIKDIIVTTTNLDQVVKDLNMVLQVRNKINDARENVNLDELTKRVERSLKPFITGENIRFQYDFSLGKHLFTIPSYITTIFYNILLNSIHYRQADIETLITVKTIQTDQQLEIIFTDNGKGIDLEKNRSVLFEFYRRFDTSVEGRGIGLYLVETKVEALGGTIDVESTVGKGTEFRIKLPVERET